jgi:hypothetical protein
LKSFLDRRSPNFVCKVLLRFHAKVIWWHGVGAYIGSANFTDAAWNQNIEAGCFFDEPEIAAQGIDVQLRAFFQKVDENSSPLNNELYKHIEARARQLQRSDEEDYENRKAFLLTDTVKHWPGLVHVPIKAAKERQKQSFIDEWFSTLQMLRNIGATVADNRNRPSWIPPTIPSGAQADQFLHAYYFNLVIVKRRSLYAEKFEANKANPAKALGDAVAWWRGFSSPPSHEDKTLLQWAPLLREALSQERILSLSENDFEGICQRVWSIQDHARRVSNMTLNLAEGQRYDMATKTRELAKFLYSRRSQNRSSVLEVISYVLHGGTDDALPRRLWEATAEDGWRIEHLGISALGELVGWALPDKFPPRNNRTSKALYALGNPVTVHGD